MKMTREIFIITLANALILAGYGMSVPFFAIYLNVERALPASMVGAVIAISTIGRAFASGISGELSDIFGRKKLMNASLVLGAVFLALMGLGMILDAHYIWIIIFHMIASFFGAFFRPSSNAWVADNVAPKNRLEAFGYIRIGLNLGWAAGPALGGLIANYSFGAAFIITAVSYIGTAAMLQAKIKETFVRSKEHKSKFTDMILELKNQRLAKLCALIFLISVVAAQLVTGLSLHGVKYIGLTQAQIGLLFTIDGSIVVLLQYHASKIMTDMRITTALIIGCIIYGSGYILVGAAHGFTLAAIGIALVATGEMAISPGSNTLISNIAPEKARGRYLGMQEVSRHIGTAAGMFGAGVMIEYLSPISQIIPWLLIGFISFTVAFLFYKIKPMFTDEEDGINQTPVPPPPALEETQITGN
ncbi:Arabinose efflux permease [Elusimicrobium minutum Pei191]|uniref:Arabinose efflux permease n=1 Tax=Elusimicrobium minutum (strain Pei191) TaxID=445932 RepID=B2KCW9_ELUMP|nr:MFS transporter [Elusimicrobium minutum]ACC98365.1 Arabinose efflux permease [Elusimicrobium minutum Pei191]